MSADGEGCSSDSNTRGFGGNTTAFGGSGFNTQATGTPFGQASSTQNHPSGGSFNFGGQTAQTGSQTSFGGTGGFFGTAQQPQQQQGGGGLFGTQQQPQQQQAGGGLFGTQQQQQQGSFGQQQQGFFGQQQPQQGAFPANNSQANGPKEAKGVESDVLEWVTGSNGSIPEDAVEGGWCTSTQEHYYIARAKDASTGGVYPGYVLPSKKLFYYVSTMINQRRVHYSFGGGNQMEVGTNPNYEVLVNPKKAETLSWLYLHVNQGFGFSSNRKNIVPKNALEAGYASNGSSLFIGRTCSHTTGDIVPGMVQLNYLIYTENGAVAPPSINFFEILCVTKKDKAAKAKDVFLYDIKYKMENAFVKWSQVPLEKASLVNKSSVEQKMSSSHQPGIPTTFKWTVYGSDIIGNTEVQIKGPVPAVFGGNKSHRLHLLDGQKLLNLLPTGRKGCFGGIENYTVFGGVINPTQSISPNLTGMFVPTLITMPLTNSLQIENTAGQEECTLVVPPSRKVVLQIQGIQAELSVPFEGKRKIIYTNNHVEDTNIEGMYDHTCIKGTAMSVVGDKSVNA